MATWNSCLSVVGLSAVIKSPGSTLRAVTMPSNGAVSRSNDCSAVSRWMSASLTLIVASIAETEAASTCHCREFLFVRFLGRGPPLQERAIASLFGPSVNLVGLQLEQIGLRLQQRGLGLFELGVDLGSGDLAHQLPLFHVVADVDEPPLQIAIRAAIDRGCEVRLGVARQLPFGAGAAAAGQHDGAMRRGIGLFLRRSD